MIRFRNILVLGLLLLVIKGCDENRNHPGYSYFPDMEQSRAYETYTENPVFESGFTNQLPVENTVPREMIPYGFIKTPDDRVKAGLEWVNPYIEASNDVITRGKEMFSIYCINCHGELGDGKGFLFTSGKYPYPPASLVSEKLKTVPDGEIFHVITVGFGMMGAHGSQVLPDDRWKIVSFIRNELQN